LRENDEKCCNQLKKSVSYIKPLNKALNVFFKDAVKISLKDPSQALYFFHTVKNQQKAARVRAGWEKQGIHVPPMMIMSIRTAATCTAKAAIIKPCVMLLKLK